jgi:hypothetical protein
MPLLTRLLNQMHSAENNKRFFKTNERNRRIQAAETRKANAALANQKMYTNSVLARRPKPAIKARRNNKYKHPHDIEMEKLMKVILGKPKRR